MLLNDLKIFVTIAELNSFTKASEELFISQPALTMSIKRLEDELGERLLTRHRGVKKMLLTQQGEIVLIHAKKILREVDILTQEVGSSAPKRVRFGVPPIIGTYIFPKLVSHLAVQDISAMDLKEFGSIEMRDKLLNDKLEMAFIGSSSPIKEDSLLETHFIMRDSYAIFTSRKNPLAARKSVSFEELKGERFITLGENFVQNRVLVEMCQKHGMTNEIKHFVTTNEFQTAKSLISNGAGIGFMISSAKGERGDLVSIPLVEPAYFYVYFAFKKGRELSTFEQSIYENFIRADSGR